MGKKWRKKFCTTRTRKPVQEGEMLCFCGLPARTFKMQEVENLAAKHKQSFQPCLLRRYGLNLELTQFSFYAIQERETESPKAIIMANYVNSSSKQDILVHEVTADLVGELAKNLCIFTTLIS